MDDTLESALAKEATTLARNNVLSNIGLNPDSEADAYNKSVALGIPPSVGRASMEDMDRRLAARQFDSLMLPPTTRGLLANAEEARVLANTPIAYERLSLQEQLWRSIMVGFEQRNIADAAKRLATIPGGVETKQGSLYALIEAQARLSKMPLSEDLQRVSDAESVGEAVRIALENPIDVIASSALTSAAAMRENLLISAGLYALNPFLGAAAMGAGSALVEYGSSISEGLQTLGVDFTDPESIRAGLSNKALVQEVLEKASTRATTVGAFDALGGMLAPFTLKPISVALSRARAARSALSGVDYARALEKHRASIARFQTPFGGAVENIGTQAAVGGTLGGAGEALAQYMTEGSVNRIGDVVLEAVSEFASAPSDVITARAHEMLRRNTEENVARSRMEAAIIQQAVEAAGQSELAQRSPTLYAEWVRRITADGPLDRVYISAEDIFAYGPGIADELRFADPDIDAKLKEADEFGTDVSMSMSTLSAIAAVKPEVANWLVQNFRLRPDGLTATELNQYDAERVAANEARLAAEAEAERARAMEEERAAQAEEAARRRAALDKFLSWEAPIEGEASRGQLYASEEAIGGFADDLRSVVPDIGRRVDEARIAGTDVGITVSELRNLALNNPEAAAQIISAVQFRTEGLTAEQEASLHEAEADLKALREERSRRQAERAAKNQALRDRSAKDRAEAAARVEEKQNREADALEKTLGATRAVAEEISAMADYAEFSREVDLAVEPIARAAREVLPEGVYREVVALQKAIIAQVATLTGLSPSAVMQANGSRLTIDISRINEYRDIPGRKRIKRIRGAYDAEGNVISLFKGADARTFVHEMAHFWLESYANLSWRFANYPTETLSEGRLDQVFFVDALLEHLGVEGKTPQERVLNFQMADTATRTKIHERFAREFEAYLATGRAPKSALQRLFERLAEFIKTSWRVLGITREELSDDVIALYDRLFSSEQISVASVAETNPIPVEANPIRAEARAKNEEFFDAEEEAERTEVEATIRARMERNARLIASKEEREIRGLEDEYKQYLKEAEDEIRGSQAFRALNALTKGVDGNEPIVLNLEAAKEELSPEMQRYASNHRWTRSGEGMSPSDAAAILGFDSAEDLLTNAISARETDVRAIAKTMADDRFLQVYGESPTEKGMHRVAVNYCFNDARLRILHAELLSLQETTGPYGAMVEKAQARAREILGREPSHRIDVRKYQQAALRASRKALIAFGKGDREAAAEYKRQEILQTVLAKEAWAFARRRNAWANRMRTIHKSSAISNGVREQLVSVLSAVGFPTRGRVSPSAPRFDSYVRSLPADVRMALGAPKALTGELPPGGILRADANTVSEFMDFVEKLVDYGRKEKTKQNNEERDRVTRESDAITATIEKNAKAMGRKPKPYTPPATTAWGKFCDAVGAFFTAHLNASALVRIFDGDDIGVAHKNLIQGANDLASKEAAERADITEKLQALLKNLLTRSDPHKDVVTIRGVKYNRIHRFVIALNAGNESNIKRLINGQGLTREEINAVLRTLTAKDLHAVQEIWDLFESFRPRIADIERRMYGTEPRWVDRAPLTVVSSDGVTVELSGGYYPVVYDQSATTPDAVRLRQADETALENGVTGLTTARSFTKDRSAEGLMAPLDLTLSGLTNGIQDVLHDITWREWLAHTGRVVTKISPTVGKYYGSNAQKVLTDWLRNIARGERQPKSGSMDRFAMAVRHGVSVAGLGYNVVSAMVQITGLIPAVTRVGAGALLGATGHFASHPVEVTQDIMRKSAFMRGRSKTMFRELNEINTLATVGASKAGRFRRGMELGAYSLMTFVQNHVDRIVWVAAYRKAVSEGRNLDDAVAYADQTVRDTQGSGLISDLSSVELGTVGKLLGSFYSFMGRAFNLQMATLLGEKDRYKAAAKLLTVSVMLPVVEGFLRSALQPGDDDEDKDPLDYLSFAAGQVTNFNLGLMLGVREVASVAGSLVSGEPVFTWRGPSSLRVFSDISQLGSQVAQGKFDLALVKAINNVAGSTFGLPAAQLNRTLTGIDAWVEEETDNPLAIILGYKKN